MQRLETNNRRRMTALIVLGVLLVSLFAVSTFRRVTTLVTLQEQTAQIEDDILWARQQQAELQAEYTFISGSEYVAEVARGELGYVQPGDDVIVVLPQTDDGAADFSEVAPASSERLLTPPAREMRWWQRVAQLFQ